MKHYLNTEYTPLQRVQIAAFGKELEVLQRVGGIDGELLDGKHHPCPKCGGRDRFSLIDKSKGAVLCRHCFYEKNGDFIAAVQWMRDCTFPEALQLIADYLGLDNGNRPYQKSEARSPKSDKPKQLRTIPFEYVNGVGDCHVLVERLEFADGAKTFRQSHWDAEQQRYVSGTKGIIAIPFDAPSFKEATTIYWSEGEKKTVALSHVMQDHKPEICCSCNWGGSKNFPKELVTWFHGKDVVIFADNDEPGVKYARRVAAAIMGTAKSVKIVSFQDYAAKFDIADWLTASPCDAHEEVAA